VKVMGGEKKSGVLDASRNNKAKRPQPRGRNRVKEDGNVISTWSWKNGKGRIRRKVKILMMTENKEGEGL